MKPVSTGSEDGSRPGSAEPATLTLSTFLPYRLNVMAALVSEGLARSYAERFGLGVPEWRVLATVAEFGSITAKAIGSHAHMGKVKVSRAASVLEARGLISRAPNAADLREAFLVLTPVGRKTYGEIAPLALDYVADLTAVFSRQELAGLDRLIDKLVHRAGEMTASAAPPRDAHEEKNASNGV